MSCVIGSSHAWGMCWSHPDADIRKLQSLVDENAAAALTQSQAELDHLKNIVPANPGRAAALYAVQAHAYGMLELDDDSRAAAAQGLQLATRADDPVHLELLAASGETLYDARGRGDALQALGSARAAQPSGSLTDTCLLISMGLLQFRQERPDLAIASLTQAYRVSTKPGFAGPHISAAGVLSSLMRSMEDYPQALLFNQEVIDWDAAHGATLALSVSRFLRGKILIAMGDIPKAIDAFAQARALSVQLNDTQGLAFADMRICDARIQLGEFNEAAAECSSALQGFSSAHSVHRANETQALIARIDLAQGHADKALKELNGVLAHGGSDLLPRVVAPAFQARARTNAALHNYRGAYADLEEYVRRYTTANDVGRLRQGAAMRARFATDREIERNVLLKRELDQSRLHSLRQAQELRLNAVVAAAGLAVIALLVYFLIVNRRYRQQLVRLASIDGLTGLANRRRIAEMATAALAAASIDKPLAIAIIDMDHFKVINDRCGHATGDNVLKEFARAGAECLRETDLLGRWGGEEFLLIMPDATLDVALASLERLRTLMFSIRLPPSGAGLRVSLSAGLAINERHGRTLDELIARADSALYAAKNEGRDMVRVAEEGFLATGSVRRSTRT